MYYERKSGYLLFLIQEKQINLKIINSIGQMISDLYTFTPMGPIPGPPPPLKQVLFYWHGRLVVTMRDAKCFV